MQILQPPGWARLKGFSHGVASRGTSIHIAGQVAVPGEIGWAPEAVAVVADDFPGQVRQVLANIVAILGEAGALPEHIVRMTWYVTDKDAYLSALKQIGEVYRDVIGRHYPVMSVSEVKGLVQPGAKVEIEATAIVPD